MQGHCQTETDHCYLKAAEVFRRPCFQCLRWSKKDCEAGEMGRCHRFRHVEAAERQVASPESHQLRERTDMRTLETRRWGVDTCVHSPRLV